MTITVRYTSIDRCSKSAKYKTLEGAQKFAQKWVGKTPEISWQFFYAVSGDGVGKVTVSGEDKNGKPVTIFDLFPGCERPGGTDALHDETRPEGIPDAFEPSYTGEEP